MMDIWQKLILLMDFNLDHHILDILNFKQEYGDQKVILVLMVQMDFRLDFSDNSNRLQSNLGKDTSGQGNNFTQITFL